MTTYFAENDPYDIELECSASAADELNKKFGVRTLLTSVSAAAITGLYNIPNDNDAQNAKITQAYIQSLSVEELTKMENLIMLENNFVDEENAIDSISLKK